MFEQKKYKQEIKKMQSDHRRDREKAFTFPVSSCSGYSFAGGT